MFVILLFEIGKVIYDKYICLYLLVCIFAIYIKDSVLMLVKIISFLRGLFLKFILFV